jgi:hypothetical protein
MLRTSNHITSNLVPVNAVIKLFIDKTAYRNVVTAYKIQSMAHLRARLRVVSWSDDSFDGVVQDDIGNLIAGEEGSN